MSNNTVARLEPSVQVTAWQREPGTVVEIAIGRTLSEAEMEELAHLTRASVRMLLKLARVGGVS